MSEVAGSVFVLWWIALAITAVLVVPVTLRFLQRTWRAARTIQGYAADTRKAAEDVAGNVGATGALDEIAAAVERMQKRIR